MLTEEEIDAADLQILKRMVLDLQTDEEWKDKIEKELEELKKDLEFI